MSQNRLRVVSLLAGFPRTSLARRRALRTSWKKGSPLRPFGLFAAGPAPSGLSRGNWLASPELGFPFDALPSRNHGGWPCSELSGVFFFFLGLVFGSLRHCFISCAASGCFGSPGRFLQEIISSDTQELIQDAVTTRWLQPVSDGIDSPKKLVVVVAREHVCVNKKKR